MSELGAVRLLCTTMILLPLASLGDTLSGPLSDPTTPPARYAPSITPVVQATGRLQLESILISPYRRIALINGLRVREGDAIGDSVVTNISSTSVSLWDGKRTFELKKHASLTVKQ